MKLPILIVILEIAAAKSKLHPTAFVTSRGQTNRPETNFIERSKLPFLSSDRDFINDNVLHASPPQKTDESENDVQFETHSGRTESGAPSLLLPQNSGNSQNLFSKLMANFRQASSDGFGTRAKNVGSTMQIGDKVVPLCGNIELRQSLAGRGVYPGVEYSICDISDVSEGEVISSDEKNEQQNGQSSNEVQRIATIRPAYPLRQHLERSDWPITIDVAEVPLWIDKATYEAGTAVGTLMLAGTYLTIASIIATFVRLAVVPSESMIPALMPGDVVLVTRSILPPRPGDIVFFDPPKELDEAIANSKIGRAAAAAAADPSNPSGNSERVNIVSTKGKNFIKRVVAVPGERVGVWDSNPFAVLACNDDEWRKDCTFRVDRTGQYSRPDVFSEDSWNRVLTTSINTNLNADETTTTLARDEFFVAGDNGFRSVDSRVWGPLKIKYLRGTAHFVVFPIQHFGKIPDGPISVEKENSPVVDDASSVVGNSSSGPWDLWKNRP